ncbi:SDR family oxidoreductase [Aquincola sp. S2]|uniref:SDR family oxidoreductase n=1 Tax=Pseudaquabacterium terrae TaxID=2732868 RepID=A0ABX2EMT9_9BURK|nr:SDR family oxidoreductase [Aquabacterium terrae]NRF70002.1 SDR family oxidoreductase [Aquabacterium terrae]
MQRLQGKTALITGGSSGIGLATAKLFLEQGARVAITGRDASALASARASLGNDVEAFRSDASKTADIDALMGAVGQRFGHLDVLFVNAASLRPAPFEAVDEARFDEDVAANFKGCFFAVQKALPLLRPKASVILTTSIANQMGSPNFSVYSACKAAQRSLVQTLALELIGRGIRVNAISPGPIATPIWAKFGLPAEVVEAAQREILSKSPSKRFGEADEVARSVLFLASDDSSYVVGQELAVDGGMSLL